MKRIKETRGRNDRGFTLVEILIVMAMMGLVTMAIMSLHRNTRDSSYTQDEVVELQQNLRIAMDQISRDIRIAGFMVSSGSSPLFNAPKNPVTGDRFTIWTASATGRALRIDDDTTVTPASEEYVIPQPSPPGGDPNKALFTVGSAAMVDLFAAGDFVRIIRPPNQSQPLSSQFVVTNRDTVNGRITLSGFSAALTSESKANETYKSGDIIVRTSDGVDIPNTIEYFLEGGEIKREANGEGALPVAAGITNLELTYLMDDDPEDTDGVAADKLDEIKAVRVTITGAADSFREGQLFAGDKTRSLTNVVMLRNR